MKRSSTLIMSILEKCFFNSPIKELTRSVAFPNSPLAVNGQPIMNASIVDWLTSFFSSKKTCLGGKVPTKE